MMGRIILENGKETVFFLSEDDVEVLEQEAIEVQKLDTCPSYSIADELASGAIRSWIEHLRSMRGLKTETPAAGTAGESRM